MTNHRSLLTNHMPRVSRPTPPALCRVPLSRATGAFAFALLAAVATGCGGISATKSFSPLDFFLPGLTRDCPPAPVVPIRTNTVAFLAQGHQVPLPQPRPSPL